MPEDLKKPELTAEWESRLSAIAKGKASDRKFMKEIETIHKRTDETDPEMEQELPSW